MPRPRLYKDARARQQAHRARHRAKGRARAEVFLSAEALAIVAQVQAETGLNRSDAIDAIILQSQSRRRPTKRRKSKKSGSQGDLLL